MALAKARCPSLGQGCRKSGLILMEKSPGFLHAFRDMSVWSVWLFPQRCCLLSSKRQRQRHRHRQRQAAGSQLSCTCSPRSHFSFLGGGSHGSHMPSPCITGLNHQISPFLTASNGVHPPTRVLSTCAPSLPNHKPSTVLSSPIGAPRWHARTHSPTSHTLTQDSNRLTTHSLARSLTASPVPPSPELLHTPLLFGLRPT